MPAIFTTELSMLNQVQAPHSEPAAVARQSTDEVPIRTLIQSLKIGVLNIAVFTLGAAVVASVVLPSGLALLGFFVALSIMSFIGLPLILASIADATQSEAHG